MKNTGIILQNIVYNKERQNASKQKVYKSKQVIQRTPELNDTAKDIMSKIADEILKDEIKNISSVDSFCSIIDNNIGKLKIMNNIDKIIYDNFYMKDDVLFILKNSDDNDYWIVVEDIFSDNIYDYHTVYYDILERLTDLNNEYFDFKVLSKEDYENLKYLNPVVLYKRGVNIGR